MKHISGIERIGIGWMGQTAYREYEIINVSDFKPILQTMFRVSNLGSGTYHKVEPFFRNDDFLNTKINLRNKIIK